MALELLGVQALLTMSGEDCLYRGVPPFHRLQGGQCCVQSVLWQVVQHRVGFLASRHGLNGRQRISGERERRLSLGLRLISVEFRSRPRGGGEIGGDLYCG